MCAVTDRAYSCYYLLAMIRIFALMLVLILSGCRSAQEKQEQVAAEAHQGHASTSSSIPSPAGKLLDGMGKVNFPITTNSKDAQAFFNQGVAQLYGFWFTEAEKSFMQAAKLDPKAAMAYWGIAMAAPADFVPKYQLVLTPNTPQPRSPYSPEARARAAITKALALEDSVTPRERLYIEAVAARHATAPIDTEAAYVGGMEKLVESFPDDLEAKAILALALEEGYDRTSKMPLKGTRDSLKLLQEVLMKEPDHAGATHFYIHALEGGKDIRNALPMANRYAAMAPNIPHVLHMPGHVYAQIGMFDEAVKSFEAAAKKEEEYISADPHYLRLGWIHNEVLLLQVLGQSGRYRDVMSHIADLMSGKKADHDSAEFFYRIGWFNLMKTLVRFEKWNEILDEKTLPFYKGGPEALWYHWSHGLANASTSNITAARESLRNMDGLIRQFETASPIPAQFHIAQSELEAYIEARAGNLKKGLDGLRRAAVSESQLPYTDPTVYPRPVLELMGKTALDGHDFVTAEFAYRRTLENEPGGGRALWGLAKALDGLGKKEGAEKTMAEFRRVWRGEELK
jgi:tetratricopeptide (TPR) repeat protein